MSSAFNRIDSKVDDISKLCIYAIPTRPVSVVTAARHDASGTVVLLDDKGKVYSSQVRRGTFWTNTNRMRGTIELLIRMGLLTAKAVKQHEDAEVMASILADRKDAADGLLQDARTLGLRLTNAQIKAIDKARKEYEVQS